MLLLLALLTAVPVLVSAGSEADDAANGATKNKPNVLVVMSAMVVPMMLLCC